MDEHKFKTLLTILAVAVGSLFYLYDPSADRLIADARTGVHSLLHGDPGANPVYAQGRVEIDDGSRRIRLVATSRLTPWDDCERQLERQIDSMAVGCDDCTVESIKCDFEPSERYRRMLRGEPVHTTYARLTRRSDEHRSTALVVWGLSDRESKRWCRQMIARIRAARDELPRYAWRFTDTGRLLRSIGDIEAACH